ncbi:hypothetical protein J2TS6_45890 [Paenibacillus albilobatus]|uniref:Uncharacterized protein n=1 Tax=Paenibacillus albilobatus TaxID=2716884 RepID=A0A920CD45_9BACL|nr:hypothetical protein J2TS6_45890 [Paenibacillus albilobatus]
MGSTCGATEYPQMDRCRTKPSVLVFGALSLDQTEAEQAKTHRVRLAPAGEFHYMV